MLVMSKIDLIGNNVFSSTLQHTGICREEGGGGGGGGELQTAPSWIRP